MSQVTSAEVPSGSGLSVRSGINAVLSALMSMNSGPSQPPNPVAGMPWFDTTAGDIKLRNTANTAWVLLSDMIGALEYDRAQTLTAPQQTQARANIGLGTTAEFALAANLLRFSVSGEAFCLDFQTSNTLGAEVWRLVMGSVVKPDGSGGDVRVNYPSTFLNSSNPVISNGDATAASAVFLSAFARDNAGFSVAGRTMAGAVYTAAYRVSYAVLGRVT